jgi:hypothetical protein
MGFCCAFLQKRYKDTTIFSFCNSLWKIFSHFESF